MPEDIIPKQESLENLSALEDVVMFGYPIGLWDSANNFPILRRGVTASHPATDFQGKEQGAILNEGDYGTDRGLTAGTRIYFLGILFAGPLHRTDGTIEVIEIPTRAVSIPVTTIPIHLGYYVKASALVSLRPLLAKAWNF